MVTTANRATRRAAIKKPQPMALQMDKEATDLFEDMNIVNLDEISPEPVTVTFREWVEETVEKDGTTITRNKLVPRQAVIETFVPQHLFVKTMRLKGKIDQWQKTPGGIVAEKDYEEMFATMSKFVLEIWQLTEPDMELDRLTKGLSFSQIMGLFKAFFAETTRLNTSRV